MSPPVLTAYTTPTFESGSLAVIDPYRHAALDVADALGVDPASGLTPDDVERRIVLVGRNEFDEVRRTPGWIRFASQFRDLLILILIGAAGLAFVVSGELKTPIVVLVVVMLNAVIGFVQENRAERSLDALKKMLVTRSKVRRGGDALMVDAIGLVPGDIVLLEAGDRVPADGRIFMSHNLEIEEAALTGESQPTTKSIGESRGTEVALGDRNSMAFMNTTVTRGRGEMIVTATGMRTEIGRIAGLLGGTAVEKSPLQKQLDGLAHSLAKLAGVIVAAVFVIGLLRGQSVSDVLLTAVVLAVAAIPEGLPAVTVVTLALGVSNMAKRNAIVKRLASVETLGCTSVICSDKTGTLTLNEMTAVELVTQMRTHSVSGSGYAPVGTIEHCDGDEPVSIDAALLAMTLCNDATIRNDGGTWELIGDPTEGALVALAAKGGLDAVDLRTRHPRLAELPFESATKFMMTAHQMVSVSGRRVVQLFAKGAPDVLLRRTTHVINEHGEAVPILEHLDTLSDHIERMASKGQRVLAIAQREVSTEVWNEFDEANVELIARTDHLTLVALVGIVDPPRQEAAVAIAEAHTAGMAVKMITGDHAATAQAIASQLGLKGSAVTGADLDRMSDEELDARIDDIGVFARVSPEHKIRLVAALQHRGNVVAMTGDGVNDAPALKKADIGVAMGITGTDVTKQAATMVLTDDNFATIVEAVRRGRTIYDNVVNFVRFQLSTTLGFAFLFLAASVFGVADGKPFTAIAILWVNMIMDGPPAMALGVDPANRDVMKRSPRPIGERILTKRRWAAVVFSSMVMAIGTLLVLSFGPGVEPEAGVATVAGTMAFNTFVLFQFFNIMNARSDTGTVFSRHTFRNRWLWMSLGGVILLQVGVTHLGWLQRLFDTASIGLAEWAVCAATASSVLWLEETRKWLLRRREGKH